MKKIAIFDVCDTLYNVNTTFSFLDFYFKKNKNYLVFRKIVKLLPIKAINYLFYKFFGKDLIRIIGTFFLKNQKLSDITKSSDVFVRNILSKEVKEKIFTKLKYYKQNGYYIVLMSGSYDFIIKEVANYFNANSYYASETQIINQLYTGRYKKDILMSKYNLFIKNFLEFEKLAVISNNKSDLKLLNLADYAYAVCNKKSDLKFWKYYSKINCIEDF